METSRTPLTSTRRSSEPKMVENPCFGFMTTALITILALAGQAPAEAGPVTTFDLPGPGHGPGTSDVHPAPAELLKVIAENGGDGLTTIPQLFGSQGHGINPSGAITGSGVTTDLSYVGFVRSRNGSFDTFQAPGNPVVTSPLAINPSGEVTGYYILTPTGPPHAFIRGADGAIVTFEVPGSGSGTGQGAIGYDINPSGTIVGTYVNGSGTPYPFLRSHDGIVQPLDLPGDARAINSSGAIAGRTLTHQGFVRSPDGTLTSFDVPGSVASVTGINSAGAVTGINGEGHAFVHGADGSTTIFDAPNAVLTLPYAINQRGTVVGTYAERTTVRVHGFIREPDGQITTIDATPEATATFTSDINPAGEITGWYHDGAGEHGYIMTPNP